MGNQITKYDAAYAEYAEKYASEERVSGGASISLRGGIMRLGEDEIEGNQICVIVLDSVKENAYYDTPWDVDQPSLPPTCFALGRSAEEMRPPEEIYESEYFEVQSEDCASCPMNEWGSGRGKGKACGNRRRLALLAAGVFVPRKGSRDFDLELFEDPKDFSEGDLAFMKLPVTSAKNWSKYVNSLASSLRRPPFGVITRISVQPDTDTQFKVHFELVEEVSEDLFDIIMDRHAAACKELERPYEEPAEEDLQRPTVKASKGIKGLKKSKKSSKPSRKRSKFEVSDED
jgi:hypothetical protein